MNISRTRAQIIVAFLFVLIPFAVLKSRYSKENIEGSQEESNSIMSIEAIKNINESNFKGKQDINERVIEARQSKEKTLENYFESKDYNYPPKEIFIRAFKKERTLEVWIKNSKDDKFQFLKDYKFTKFSGKLGPKRMQGDLQIPEGFYHIDRFNPLSKFYLSLGLNYPNESDKLLGHEEKPGKDIFIHGGADSVGCIPIGDENIKELYILAIEAKNSGQNDIQVHIFPSRFSDEGIETLNIMQEEEKTINFWRNLKEGYDYFEKNKILPRYRIGEKGEYIFR
jgi:murein L,D-transpeptidase YafK